MFLHLHALISASPHNFVAITPQYLTPSKTCYK